jgi:hypothetical protein
MAGHFVNGILAVIPQTVTPDSYRILLRIVDAKGQRFFVRRAAVWRKALLTSGRLTLHGCKRVARNGVWGTKNTHINVLWLLNVLGLLHSLLNINIGK